MILGLGSDLTDIRRIEQALDRFGDRFTQRVFSEEERQRCDAHRQRAASYAKRYAAKEAGAKALGTGIRDGIFLRDFVVINLPNGRPTLELRDGAAQQLARMVPPGCRARIDLSLSDEYPLAQAIVILSAERVIDAQA